MDITVNQIWRSREAMRIGARRYAIVERVSDERVVIKICGRDGPRKTLYHISLERNYDLIIDTPECSFCSGTPTIRQMSAAGVFEVWCHGLPIVRGNGYQAEAMASWRQWCIEFEPIRAKLARKKETRNASRHDAGGDEAAERVPRPRRKWVVKPRKA
jgi:hypothetical protein